MSMPFGFFCLYLLHIVLFNTNKNILLCCLFLFASVTALSVTVLPSLLDLPDLFDFPLFELIC